MGKGKRNKHKRRFMEYNNVLLHTNNHKKMYGSKNTLNPYTYDEFYNSLKIKTRMRESIKEFFKNANDKNFDEKYEKWDMEYCWWGSFSLYSYSNRITGKVNLIMELMPNHYSMNSDFSSLDSLIEKNLKENIWFDENEYVLEKFHANTNKTPDYIVKNIKNDTLIGIEISSAQFPLHIETKNEYQFKALMKTIEKRAKENKTMLDRAKEIIDKKTKRSFDNWECVDKRALVITFESNPDSRDLINIYIESWKYNKQKENSFDYLSFSFGG